MMKVLAGDWKAGDLATFRVSAFGNKPKFLIMPGRFPYERIDFDKIKSIDHVTDENKTSVMGKAAWGAAGAVLLGPVGLLAGVLGGGNVQKRVVSMEFTDGRKVLLECTPDDFKALLSVQYGSRT